MQTIYKYQLEIADTQEVALPAGAQVLSVQVQNGLPVLWALVNTDQPLEPLTVYMYGTGHPVHMSDIVLRFIDTIQLERGQLVFHVFHYVPY